LSPSYDLLNIAILIPDDKEELALTIGGKKKKLKRKQFEQFGIGLGLTNKQIKGTFMRMEKNKSEAIDLIDRSFLSDKMKIAYMEVLESKYKQIE
jgi:serine/threonine-protein kinase HipA